MKGKELLYKVKVGESSFEKGGGGDFKTARFLLSPDACIFDKVTFCRSAFY